MARKTNEEILEKIATLAAARTAGDGKTGPAFKLHGEHAGYVRVTGSGYRAVSVSPDYPLCKFGKAKTSGLSKAVEQAEGSPVQLKDKGSREERCVQAHVIRKALASEGDLLAVLGRELPFEELRFAFDEVRLNAGADGASGGTVRCDLLAVGRLGGVHVPVVIELKFNRAATRLKEQLESFADLVKCYPVEFKEAFSAATGNVIDPSKVYGIVVWPARGRNAKQVEEMRGEGICAVAYLLEGEVGRSRKSALHRVKRFEVEARHAMPLNTRATRS